MLVYNMNFKILFSFFMDGYDTELDNEEDDEAGKKAREMKKKKKGTGAGKRPQWVQAQL